MIVRGLGVPAGPVVRRPALKEDTVPGEVCGESVARNLSRRPDRNAARASCRCRRRRPAAKAVRVQMLGGCTHIPSGWRGSRQNPAASACLRRRPTHPAGDKQHNTPQLRSRASPWQCWQGKAQRPQGCPHRRCAGSRWSKAGRAGRARTHGTASRAPSARAAPAAGPEIRRTSTARRRRRRT